MRRGRKEGDKPGLRLCSDMEPGGGILKSRQLQSMCVGVDGGEGTQSMFD